MSTARRVGIDGARRARLELGLGLDAPLRDLLDAVEHEAGVPVAIMPFPDGVAGMMRRLREGSFIFVSGNQRPARQRFTLAHEFGHFFLDHGSVVDSPKDIFGRSPDAPEHQANYFAGEFLAPSAAINAWIEHHPLNDGESAMRVLVRMGNYFGISPQSACVRLQVTGRISAQETKRLQDRLRSGEHYGVTAEMGLREFEDSLEAIARRDELPYLPSSAVAGVRTALRANLVELDEAAELLRRTPERAQKLLDESDEADDAEAATDAEGQLVG